jgi:CRISPR-associated protein Cmr2
VEKEYLQEYLLIAAAVNEVENPILDMGKVMDSFELAKPIVRGRENNPLLSLLIGEQNYGNEAVKKLEIVKGFRNWQLLKTASSLKSIPDIAAAGVTDKLKKHSYFAIVRADGDHMGDVIKKLSGENVRDFSKNCLIYCGEIAKLVGKYGGVTIYSGGDDLLALMPCENAEQMTIFEFIQEANGLFTKSFPKETYQADVSLSWGVTICYHKFPLYEAMEDSYHMLTKIAKKRRNCVAVHLQKHAGQSEGLIIPNDAMEKFVELMGQCMFRKDSEWLHSIHHKLNQFRSLFNSAQLPATVQNLFANLFDAEAHQNNDLIHKNLPEFFCDMKADLGIVSVEAAKEHDTVDTLCYILRLFKFFVEKGGEEK